MVVAYIVADMEVDIEADMEVDMVANMVADNNFDIISQFRTNFTHISYLGK